MNEVRLIDANALKKAFNKWWGCDDIPATVVEDIIDNAPTVEPTFGLFKEMLCAECEKRPQGEWIEKVERRGCFAGDKTVYSYTCPFCGVKEFKKYPFCHCGADMRGKEE